MAQLTRLIETEAVVDPVTAEGCLEPRGGWLQEREVSPGSFVAAEGPVDHYSRKVVTVPVGPGQVRVVQQVELDPAIPWVASLFRRPMARLMGRLLPPDKAPWWLPPDRLDAQAA